MFFKKIQKHFGEQKNFQGKLEAQKKFSRKNQQRKLESRNFFSRENSGEEKLSKKLRKLYEK